MQFGFFVLVVFLMSVSAPVVTVFGATNQQQIDQLQAQIDEHNKQIADIDREIAQYEAQLTVVGAKKKTLQTAISQLDLSRKKVVASITATRNKISTLQLQIQQLSFEITNKQTAIERDRAALAASLRTLSRAEDVPLMQAVLTRDNLSSAWRDVDTHLELQSAIGAKIEDLRVQQSSLSKTKQATEQTQTNLMGQQKNLVSQQGSLDATRKAQNELLTQTKSKESEYQKLIRAKESAKANFENALQNLKSQLNYQVSPSDILTVGKGVLSWPFDRVRITQFFGNTEFARSGAYAGKGHNGIDLAASVGTPVKTALSGTVAGTGNTDLIRGCYSFGKWVLVRHGNGLSTLYAHLSSIQVSPGDSVGTGDLVGYAGETGYATGPHLHFGVYVSSATQIIKLGEATRSSTPCSNATMPVAPLSAYLNPMEYLPSR